jgi:hypothetical protein
MQLASLLHGWQLASVRTPESNAVLACHNVRSIICSTILMSITDKLPFLRHSSLYHPIRNTYLCFFKHEFWKTTIRDVRRFYSGFVGPGALVFDVGANVGTYSKMFLSLGASVVAVEPTPSLIKDLQRIPKLKVEGCALGDADGVLPLSVSKLNHLNSLVPSWEKQIAGARGGDRKRSCDHPRCHDFEIRNAGLH